MGVTSAHGGFVIVGCRYWYVFEDNECKCKRERFGFCGPRFTTWFSVFKIFFSSQRVFSKTTNIPCEQRAPWDRNLLKWDRVLLIERSLAVVQ